MSEAARATTAVPWRRAALIVAAALVVKLVVLFQLWDHPLLAPHAAGDDRQGDTGADEVPPPREPGELDCRRCRSRPGR